MWYVYVLLCADRSLYTGISLDLRRRFLDHKSGKGSRYTRMKIPKKFVYSEKCKSKSEALKREKQIKGWSRRKKIDMLRLDI